MQEKILDPARVMEEYNALWKEQNEIYSAAARRFGLSDSAMWTLYFLRQGGGSCSQKEICSNMFQPKQTVNSTIKQLESRGYVRLSSGDDRRCRTVTLTDEGDRLAQRTSDLVITGERQAIAEFPPEEREQLIALLRKYNQNLRERLK